MPETPKNEHVSVELLRSWADDEVPWHDAAQIPRGIFVVAADEIERLRAENAALKARLVVDDAMIGRAEEALCESARYDPDVSTFTMVRRLLEAALGKEPNA